MERATKTIIPATAGLAGAVGPGAATIAPRGGATPSSRSPAVRPLDRARSVACGGRIRGSEVGDEEGGYEVEMIRARGTVVDVHLDARFAVIDATPDGLADRTDSRGN